LKRFTARGPALVIALVALVVALGGSAYARASSTAKVQPARAKVTTAHKVTLKAVKSEATAPKPTVEPAPFTG
jgi:hypothetical protein